MAYTAGVDVGGTKILAIAVDEAGHRVGQEVRRPTPRGAEALFDALVGVLTELRAEVGELEAIGVGVPGLVARNGRLAVGPNLPGIENISIRDELQSRTRLPVAVDNDATCATWAEVQLGAARGATEALMVTLGTGIGGGVVTGGVLQRGANGYGGEPGHMVVDPKGPPCPCGRRGCWERFASGSGLGRLAREAAESGHGGQFLVLAGGDPDDVRGEHVTKAALDGDAAALDVFREFGWWAALGIANLVNVLDPQVVVVGGGLVGAGEVVLRPIREAFPHLVLASEHRPQVDIVAAQLGNDAGAIGAALISRDRRD